jgi:hypothetical protein
VWSPQARVAVANESIRGAAAPPASPAWKANSDAPGGQVIAARRRVGERRAVAPVQPEGTWRTRSKTRMVLLSGFVAAPTFVGSASRSNGPEIVVPGTISGFGKHEYELPGPTRNVSEHSSGTVVMFAPTENTV